MPPAMPPAKTPPQPGLPLAGEPTTNQRHQHSDPPTERIAARRDPEPTQGPGSAAGDSATRAAFVAGAPIHDGKAITPPTDPSEHAPAASSDGAPAPAEDTPVPVPQSTAAPKPTQAEDGPGPINAAGQRVPISFDPQNADEMYRYAQMLARSTLLPRAFYDRDDKEKRHARVGDVHFVLMKGRALGLHPMTSIGNINIIDGKAEVGALLMLSMVRRSGVMAPGGWKLIHSDDRRATFSTLRVGDDAWTTFEYTIEEAEQMGLLDKGRDEWAKANNQWRKQPRTMLRRRCQSMLLREVYSDVVLGCYDHDELSELRERELALGIDPDRVVQIENAGTLTLPDGSDAGPIKRLTDEAKARSAAADPLKARLEARRAAAGGTVARCSLCDTPLDPRDSDPCIACRPAPTAG